MDVEKYVYFKFNWFGYSVCIYIGDRGTNKNHWVSPYIIMQLSVVTVRGSLMSTRLLLCEHVEKLEAAIALRELHTE